MADIKRKERVPIGGDTESARSRRIPLLDPRDRLSFPQDPAYKRVWVTDNGKGQVQDYMDSGFSFVNKDDIGWVGENALNDSDGLDSRVTKQVGKAGVYDNATAYLMQMPMEEYKILQEAIHAERSTPIREIQEASHNLKREGYYGEGIELK